MEPKYISQYVSSNKNIQSVCQVYPNGWEMVVNILKMKKQNWIENWSQKMITTLVTQSLHHNNPNDIGTIEQPIELFE